MRSSLDLSLEKARKKSSSKEVTNPWDEAIAEARQRIADLKFSIKVFERKKAEGAEWLGLERQ